MKILVVGGGGREHAIIRSLKKTRDDLEIYCAPGNGGISYDANVVDINSCDIQGLVDFATSKKIDYAIVAQDDPLALGPVDEFEKVGIKPFGPNKRAAQIESSKVFSKNLMKKYSIPTADYESFDDPASAIKYLENINQYPIVIKADGLALGKGVLICEDEVAAKDAIKQIMVDKKFGNSGNRIVIEEFLKGPEVSILSFCDGKTCIPLISSMDHKRALDGDNGLNTGGMGVVAPNPFYTAEVAKVCEESIFKPTIDAMQSEGCPFKGCLYFGLMITKDGPKVIEYNCRFGDPEAQCILPLLNEDLLDIMVACTDGNLENKKVSFKDRNCAVVVLASGGYPSNYEKGYEISGLNAGQLEVPDNDVEIIHAGTKRDGDKIFTNGGRVLNVVSLGNTLEDALNGAYSAIEKIDFKDKFFRKDIGKKALDQKATIN